MNDQPTLPDQQPIDLRPRPMHSLADAAGAGAQAHAFAGGGLIHRFRIPPSLAAVAGGVAELGLVLVTPNGELMAAQRAAVPMRLAFELARESLVEVGQLVKNSTGQSEVRRQAVSMADGTAEALWARMHPKLRTLAITAYANIHNPDEEEVAGFLASREVSTR